MLGGIEAGGTKFVCAVGKEDGTIIDRVEIPTTMPDETIEKVI
ncbi:ROK family protein, partial [Bacillus inaquosorum]